MNFTTPVSCVGTEHGLVAFQVQSLFPSMLSSDCPTFVVKFRVFQVGFSLLTELLVGLMLRLLLFLK